MARALPLAGFRLLRARRPRAARRERGGASRQSMGPAAARRRPVADGGCYSDLAVVLPSSVRWGRSLARLASPMPFTASRSSRLLKPPFASRASITALARDAPMPGSISSSAAVAVFTLTTPVIFSSAKAGTPAVARRAESASAALAIDTNRTMGMTPGTGRGARRRPLAIARDGELGSGEQVALGASIGEGSDRGARAARVLL